MIKIQIKNSKKVYGDKAAFFSFDFDQKIINTIKESRTRYYHGDTRQWEIPVDLLGNLLNKLQSHQMEIIGDFEVQKQKVENPILNDFKFKTKPFDHQIQGFKYGLEKDSFLLGDEQGLGKTKQAIDIAVAKKKSLGYKHCLIVCGVNGLKWNWEYEIGVHSDEKSCILGERLRANGNRVPSSTKTKIEDLENLSDAYFLITNVESLRSPQIQTILKKLIEDKQIEMVVVDEIHKCKNPSSAQGKGLLKLNPETKIAMTGTPLMNTPLDLYIILKWLGYEKHSFYQFKNYFCVMGGFGGYQIVGYKNLNLLQKQLDENMLRRLKKDVLDLPDKLHVTEYVEMGKEQAKIYKQVQSELRRDIDKIKISVNPLDQLIRLRQATGYTGILSSSIEESAKIDRLEEIVDELVDNGEKVIIFSNWTSITDAVHDRLKKYNPAIITGQTKNRAEEQKRFTENPDCKCIIGTIGAMGTGLTLTAASTVIFMDSPWNRANKEQAEDRAHRIGTTSVVNIITLVCKDTIDERIEDIIYKKGKMADIMVDQEVDLSKSDLVNYLIG